MTWRRAAVTVASYALVTLIGFAGLRAFTPIRVSGQSMRPALYAGDLVFVSRDVDARRGEIILMQHPGRGPVLHRVVGVESDGSLRTKGDANEIEDLKAAKPAYVKGTVVAVLPVGAAIERWRRN